VAESAVIGVPHPDFGEAVVAVVVPAPGHRVDEATLIERSRSHLARYKCPKRVFSLPALPRNTMGKVQKNALRTQYADVFQAHEESTR
jgi:malonyl-CoA/methylmalonyl-CoA synthetase